MPKPNYSSKKYIGFEGFIAIDNNLIAKNTAIEFSQGKLNKNVLKISSSLGNGATHLAFAILSEIENQDSTKTVFHASWEAILYKYSNKNFEEVFNNNFFQHNAAILIDSYFETTNHIKSKELIDVLKNANTTIIFTCTNSVAIPMDGYEINLVTPSKIEKLDIVSGIIEQENLQFNAEIIDYIAGLDQLSVREIEALIVCALGSSSLSKCDIDLEFIKQTKQRLFDSN